MSRYIRSDTNQDPIVIFICPECGTWAVERESLTKELYFELRCIMHKELKPIGKVTVEDGKIKIIGESNEE